MANIILLGDSIFDNKSYVGNEPDVIEHLREKIPSEWTAVLKAVDGSVVANISGQLQAIPFEATHLFISVGGNDAIQNADVLQMKSNSSAEVLNVLAQRAGAFERQYGEMLRQVLSRNLPTAVCTIYYPNFADPLIQKIAVTALTVFNDAIIRQAILSGIPFLDLRLICREKADYANEIEPSSKGGRKIAAKILEAVNEHDFSKKRTQVFI